MEPTFSIAEISQQSGLSYDTVRYYVKIGLLPPAKLKENGQREYGAIHLEQLKFILHLKRTGMPLKEIEGYMTLASAQNYENCYSVLYKHKHNIESQMAEMNEALEYVNYKLGNIKKRLDVGGN